MPSARPAEPQVEIEIRLRVDPTHRLHRIDFRIFRHHLERFINSMPVITTDSTRAFLTAPGVLCRHTGEWLVESHAQSPAFDVPQLDWSGIPYLDALATVSEEGGWVLLHLVNLHSGEKAGCFQCHGGVNSNGTIATAANPLLTSLPHSGLYNLAGELSCPAPHTGLHAYTGAVTDVGKFRAPTLRNIALTAPYMHDDSVSTLEDAIEHYAQGGRSNRSAPSLVSAATIRTEVPPSMAST